jgi:predicted dehydrogenase
MSQAIGGCAHSATIVSRVWYARAVFGAAFAGGWAIAGLFGLGDYGVHALQVILFLAGIAVMVAFVRAARRVERFVTR